MCSAFFGDDISSYIRSRHRVPSSLSTPLALPSSFRFATSPFSETIHDRPSSSVSKPPTGCYQKTWVMRGISLTQSQAYSRRPIRVLFARIRKNKSASALPSVDHLTFLSLLKVPSAGAPERPRLIENGFFITAKSQEQTTQMASEVARNMQSLRAGEN